MTDRILLRTKSNRFRALILLGSGLLVGVLAVVAGAMLHLVDAHAATPASCAITGTSPNIVLTITLEGGTVTLTNDGAGHLVVSPSVTSPPSASCGGAGGTPFSSFNSIAFAVDDANGAQSTVVFDQAANQFPCIPISGAVGDGTVGAGTVDINGHNGQNMTVGSTGAYLGQTFSCSAVAQLTGVASYQLSDNTATSLSSVTLSAAGDINTGGPATVPVTFIGGTASHPLSGSTFIGGAGGDTYTVIGNTNTFHVGTGKDTVTDTSTANDNTLDFGKLQTSTNAGLAINVSGTSESVGSGGASVTVTNGQAAVGSLVTDTFTASAFRTLFGSAQGNTDFLGGDSGSGGTVPVTFAANSSGNSADFSAAKLPVTVNLSGNTLLSGLPNSEVGVNGGDDVLSNIPNVTGSSAGGNTFYAGSASLDYKFTGNGNGNFFYGGSGGTDTFTSNGTSNHFIAGTADSSFVDPTAGAGSTLNVVDLSSSTITAPAVVNVSPSQDVDTASGTATAGTSVYTFTGLAEPITFLGAQSGTQFDAGAGQDAFNGYANVANTLNYGLATGSGPLTLNAVTGRATLGSATATFSNITTFDGLAAGNTTFDVGATGGLTLHAVGSGNSADFTAAGSDPITADLFDSPNTVTIGGTCTVSCSDTISGLTSITGASGGGNTFIAGSSSETFGGGGPGDTINFSHVSTGPGSLLTVNTSGSTVGSQVNYTAFASPFTYNFAAGGADFTNFIGSSAGNTQYLAGETGGYNFAASLSNDSIDFSAATGGVTVNLTTSPGTVTGLSGGICTGGPPCPDDLTGITTVTGASGGNNNMTAGSAPATFIAAGANNTFVGGSGTDSFTGNGSPDTFTAGTGNDTFADPVSGNIVDLSQLASASVVDVSGVQDGGTPNNTATATSPAATYNFNALTAPTTFKGSQGGTRFDAGTAGDTFQGDSSATGNELNFKLVASGGPLTVCTASLAPACPTPGQATLASVPEPFSNITTFDGLNGGSTTFVAGTTAGYTFNAFNSNNLADFTPAGSSAIVANLSATTTQGVPPGQVQIGAGTCPTGCDTVNGLTSITGSSGGNNIFVAGSSNETFGQAKVGIVTPGGDTVDFTNVNTGPTTPLTVNLSGQPFGTILNNSASVGAVTYTFNASYPSPPAFTKFIGSAGGNTNFEAGSTGGYTFTASPTPSNDSVDFSTATSGVTVNLTTSPGTVTGLTGGSDTLNGLTTVTGAAGGGNTMTAGSTPVNFTADGPNNTFVGGSGTGICPNCDIFTGNGTHNVFKAGTLSDTFNDTASGNTVDLSALSSAAAVDVSGVQVGATSNGTATAGNSVYTFTSLTAPTTFVGSTGGTTFYAGGSPDSFIGKGSGTSNSLNYGSYNGGSALAICLVTTATTPACDPTKNPGVTTNTAVLGTVNEPFSDIQSFVGLSAGATTFVSGATQTDTFTGNGVGNTLDFSADPNPITANLFSGSVSDTSGTDTLVGNIASVIGSKTGPNDFIAGLGSETFTDLGPATNNDKVDFTNLPTSGTTGLTINVSGRPVNGANNSTGVVSGSTYTFTDGPSSTNAAPDFTSFVGATNGFTRFDANGTIGGYTFDAPSGSSTNIADFSANTVGVAVNMVSGQVTSTAYSNPDTLKDAFTAPGSNTVIGSGSAGAKNVFDGNLLGTQFTASGSSGNTLSYVNENSGSGVNLDLSADVASPLSTTGIPVADTWTFGTGSQTIQGSPLADTFVLGSGSICPTGGSGPCPRLESGGGEGIPTGPNADTLDLSQMPVGVTANLALGTVTRTGSLVTYATFTTGCVGTALSSGDQLCLATIDNGSAFPDGFVANAQSLSGALPDLTINGGGSDTLGLAPVTAAATVCMPLSALDVSPLGAAAPCTSTGTVTAGLPPLPPSTSTPGVCANDICFTGVTTIDGTKAGGDYIYDGSGTASFVEAPSTNAGFLNFSNLPGTGPQPTLPNPPSTSIPGVTVAVSNVGGSQQGTVTTPLQLNDSDTFSGFGTFIGTQGNDSFSQSGPGTYTFDGGQGVNSLDLSSAPAGATLSTSAPVPIDNCSTGSGFSNTDGATYYGPNPPTPPSDTFSCISNLTAPANATYDVNSSNVAVSPGQTATINGGGTGTLSLVGDSLGGGATVNFDTGWVTGDGYNFQFTGISNVTGTQWNDTFVPGTANVTINGGGGQDGLNYESGSYPLGSGPVNSAGYPNFPGATAAVDVNLSNNSYTVPAGMPNAGTTVAACSAIGGFGGTVTMPGCGVTNVTGTSTSADVLVAGSGNDTLAGGSGNDRFVLTNGGHDTVIGGSGASTLDLSQLTTLTTFALGNSSVQPLGTGSVQVLSGNIATVIASPAGSNLYGGTGNGITLMGGPGNDTLQAGTGTQTLIGGGGNDNLVGGVGSDTLVGGTSPVTFAPGEGADTLTSSTTGNTLNYAGDTNAAQINLSTQDYQVPLGKPFASVRIAALTALGGFSGSSANLSGAGITQVVGTSAGDIFVTNSGNDHINGGGGNDLFAVESGGNTLTEPAGSSPTFLFQGASGSNVINGGGGGTVDFSQATSGVDVNLQNGSASGAFGNQSLSGIRSVIGSNYQDILVAAGPGATLQDGNGPHDLMVAGPTGGDTLTGGGIYATFCSESSCGPAGVQSGGGSSPATENHMVGTGGDQYFFTVNGGYDTVVGGGGGNYAEIDSHDTIANPSAFTTINHQP